MLSFLDVAKVIDFSVLMIYFLQRKHVLTYPVLNHFKSINAFVAIVYFNVFVCFGAELRIITIIEIYFNRRTTSFFNTI